jgi:hypothetical protein
MSVNREVLGARAQQQASSRRWCCQSSRLAARGVQGTAGLFYKVENLKTFSMTHYIQRKHVLFLGRGL